MSDFIFHVIVDDLHHPWQEHVFWWCQSLVLLAGVAAAVLAWVQLRSIGHSARATFILELDRRWDSPEMIEARQILLERMEEARATAAQRAPLVNDEGREKVTGEVFGAMLADLRAKDLQQYLKIMRICGFLETAGLLVKRSYVPAAEIMGLFKGAIQTVNVCFIGHIEDRQKETGVPAGFYEHARYLCTLLPKYRD